MIIIKGGAYIILGQAPDCNSCLRILSVGRSSPGRCCRGAGAVFGRNPWCAAPSAFSPALPGRAESPALLVPGTSLHSEQRWEAGKRTQLLHNRSHPCQLPPTPVTATWQSWFRFFYSLCHRSLFNLPELYLKDTGSCRKILGRKICERRPFAA